MTSTHQPSNDQLGPLTPFQGNPAKLSVVLTEYWDVGSLAWVKGTQPSGGGGATTIADGADVAEGATGNTLWLGGATGTTISLLKSIAASYALRFDSAASPVLYLGQAIPGSSTAAASWQIQKIDTTTGVAITFADGDQLFDNIWDNRAGLAYS